MERRQLEFFLAIAEAGSFTRAAARLHVAQPSLSYAIRGLEKELGVELFERLGRGVSLTAAGEALLGPAGRTVRAFELAAGAVRSLGVEGRGQLRIVSSTMWAIDPLAPLLGALRRLLPGVQVIVTDPRHRADVLDQVRSGEADLGLLDGQPPTGAFDSMRVGDQELVAVLPPGTDHPGTTIGIDEVADRGLIATPPGTALRELLDRRLEEVGRPGDVAIETAHVASVIPLVLSGAGVALVPSGLAAAALRDGAVPVPLAPPSHAQVSLIWRSRQLDAVADQLIALAQDRIADRLG